MYKSILAISEGGPPVRGDVVRAGGPHGRDVRRDGGCRPFLREPRPRCRYRGPGHALPGSRLLQRTAEARAPRIRTGLSRADCPHRRRHLYRWRRRHARPAGHPWDIFSSVLLIGRPGADADNIAPATVKAAIYDCARPVVIAPPKLAPNAGTKPISSVVVAWNGSAQAARAVGYALPFLENPPRWRSSSPARSPRTSGTSLLVRNLGRRGIAATVETIEYLGPFRAAPAAAPCWSMPGKRKPTFW